MTSSRARRPGRSERRAAGGLHATTRSVPAGTLYRGRGHVVVGGSPHHRRPDLLLPVRPRPRHRAGPGLARGLRHGHRHVQEPDRQPDGGRAGRRGALPRAQRPADHRGRLLVQGPAATSGRCCGPIVVRLGRRDGPRRAYFMLEAHRSKCCSGATVPRCAHELAGDSSTPAADRAAALAPSAAAARPHQLRAVRAGCSCGCPASSWSSWCSATC